MALEAAVIVRLPVENFPGARWAPSVGVSTGREGGKKGVAGDGLALRRR